jgi:hypothetical protein
MQEEEEQLPSIYMFLARLKDAMEAGPLALAVWPHHMDLYAREAFAESLSSIRSSCSWWTCAWSLTWIYYHYRIVLSPIS